jgi:hypothetical protein
MLWQSQSELSFFFFLFFALRFPREFLSSWYQSMSAATADPNGWVRDPPATFVKVVGTTREAINGKLGLVLAYAADRRRYTVVLCQSQDQRLSLRADNLAAASLAEKATAHVQMFRNSPELRRQLRGAADRVQAATGVKPEYLAAGALLLFVAGVYFLGFSRVMMMMSFCMMVFTVIGQDVLSGADARTVIANAPSRWREIVRTQVPVVGPAVAGNRYLLSAVTALLAAVFVKGIFFAPGTTKAAAARGAPPPAILLTSDQQERFYKLGFDDATAERPFGTSLPAPDASDLPPPPLPAAADDYDDDFSWSSSLPTPKKSPWNAGTALSAFAVFRMLSPLFVRNAEGRFDLASFRARLTNMEVWRLGLLGFSIYRLVAAFL